MFCSKFRTADWTCSSSMQCAMHSYFWCLVCSQSMYILIDVGWPSTLNVKRLKEHTAQDENISYFNNNTFELWTWTWIIWKLFFSVIFARLLRRPRPTYWRTGNRTLPSIRIWFALSLRISLSPPAANPTKILQHFRLVVFLFTFCFVKCRENLQSWTCVLKFFNIET